jgi:hypothetical protein
MLAPLSLREVRQEQGKFHVALCRQHGKR